MYINYYKNLFCPDVLGTMPISQYINWVKEGFEEKTVDQIRFYGKGHTKYDQLKKQRWTVSFNFLFDKKKRNANIKCASGLMMFDLDFKDMVQHGFEIESLNLDDIYILHKSIGGKGYTIIVKVDCLTLDNFKYNYNFIGDQLGVSEVMDLNARKATQYTILSYDPSIFVNPQSTTFKTQSEPIKVKQPTNSTTLDWASQLANYEFTNYTYTGNQLRYNNLQDFIKDDEDYIYDYQNGYTHVSVPYRYSYPINQGGRTMHLFITTVKIVWLNPHAAEQAIKEYLYWLNNSCHVPPLSEFKVDKTLNYVMENKERFEPLTNKKPKKIIFNNKLGWTRDQKMEVVYHLNAENKKEISKAKMDAILEFWDFEKEGKITQRAIYKHYEISKKTVEKYWGEYKEHINHLNTSRFNTGTGKGSGTTRL